MTGVQTCALPIFAEREDHPIDRHLPRGPGEKVIAEVGESGEFYMVFVTTVILIAVLYFLQKWWTTYR